MKKVTVVLDNIRSIYNVGAILRTCEGLGVSSVVFSGVTPSWLTGLPHVREKNLGRISKVALGAEKMVPAEYVLDVITWMRERREAGWKIVALEQDERSAMLGSDSARDALRDANVVLILGEEVEGVSPEVLGEADVILEIPMRGKKESFNVSVAAGMALFEIMK